MTCISWNLSKQDGMAESNMKIHRFLQIVILCVNDKLSSSQKFRLLFNGVEKSIEAWKGLQLLIHSLRYPTF